MNARLMIFLIGAALALPDLAGCQARPATPDTTPVTAAAPPPANAATTPPSAAAPAPAAARPAPAREATLVPSAAPAASPERKEPRRDGGGSRKAVVQRPAAVVGAAAAPRGGGDWPQWRGPDRTGVSRETGLLKSWPAEGPRLLWKAQGLGGGHSTPSIARGRIFGMSYRGDDEYVWALEATAGKPVWSTRIASANYSIGPQAHAGSASTPTVDGDRLYTLGESGDLVCLQVADGKLLWQKSLVQEFGGSVPRWGYSESPLVDGDKVIATPGGSDATLVALNKRTGDVIWKAQVPGGNEAHYSSVIAADVNGQRQYIQFLGGGVVGIAAKDGKFLWRYENPANRVANISTPIYRDQHVFAASGYGTGGGLARLMAGPDGTTATEVYFTKRMQNHHGGVVLVGDHLYGFDGSNLTCLNWKTGEVAWSDRSVGKGAVVAADGHLIARSERGPVALVEATPKGYVEKGRFDQPDRTREAAWAHPVIAGGRLYLRDQDLLLCYDVKG
jgi:outer membrane protein assembly factor BamB